MISLLKTWKQDIPAGLVVFLVAVPLCLGIALASDASPFSGLIAGIIGGIIVGFFSGSAVGVSGPAAGLAAIVATSIHDLGSFNVFLFTVVIAGVIQFVLGLSRMGFISAFFPNAVIKGMLAAIGLLIIFKQFPHAVGYDADFEGDENFIQPDGHNTFSELYYSLNYISVAAIIICAVSIVVIRLWDHKRIQSTFLRFVPAPLVVVILGILFTLGFQSTELALATNHRVDLGISGKNFGQLFQYPDFSQWANPKVYIIAATIAVVASLETLLSVDASDKLDPKKRVTSGNRELLAQGIGNIASGLIGGLPVTQVVVRTSANVNSGGMNKTATIVHGLLIAIVVLSIPMVFGFIPYASLAAILIMVGYKLAKPTLFKKVWKEGKSEFAIFMVTILAILFSDLLKGIGVGMALSFILYFVEGSKAKRASFFRKAYTVHRDHQTVEIEFFEHVSFLSKAAIGKLLNKIEPGTSVIINRKRSIYFSGDIQELIHNFGETASSKNIQIHVRDRANASY